MRETTRSPRHELLRSSGWVWLVFLAIAVMAPFVAKGQIGGTGAIQGTVTDSSGALVVGAKVIAHSLATGAEMTRTADKDGFYVLSPLDVGDYTVTATAKGFEKLLRENIHVDGMEVLSLNLTLQVGSQTLTVTVTDTPPPLETENATLGSVMENEVYQSLPLEMGAAGAQDQRRATDFAALMPGVSNNETKNNETDEPMVINGNQASSEMYMEGIPVTSVSVAGDPRYIWSAFSVETVDQFQLKTSAYSAEYRGLGIENFTIKSATSKLHGTVYDVLRNTAFDAAGFIPSHYTDLSGTAHWYTPPEHMNEYGLSVGGPVWRNKVFLFANYMGYRFSQMTTPQYEDMPTAKMQTGDFSELLSLATPVKIYDPITQTCKSTSSCSRSQASYNGHLNVLPPTEISPIAKQMESFLPALSNSNLTNNYLGSYGWGLSNWTQSDRLDYDVSPNQKISVIFGAGRQGLIGASGSQTTNVAPLPYRYAKVYAPITKDVMVEHTYLINQNLVNQFKYAALQYHSPSINPTYNVSPWEASTFGVTGLPVGQTASSFPDISFGSSDVASWGPQASSMANTDNFTALDNLQWIHGKHSISFGGQYQWLGYNYNADATGSSPLTLKTAVTETANLSGVKAVSGTGYDYASFLLGAFDSASYTEYAQIAKETGTRFHPFALFVQDDYKVSSKLTVNAGLRWDVLPPMTEAHDRFSFLNPDIPNPYTGTLGALQFAGNGTDGCNCKTPINTYFKNFGPRLGFAYAINDKTVLRASGGIYYALGGGVGGTANSTQPGSALELGYSAAPSPSSPGYALPVFYLNGNPGVSKTTLPGSVVNDPTNVNFGGAGYSVTAPPIFDAGYATAYSTASTGVDNIASTLGYLDPYYGGRAPEFNGWSFGFQRSVTKDMTATLSYVGNEGHFLVANNGSSTERGIYNNQMDPKYLASVGPSLGTKVSALNLANLGLSLPFPTFNTGQNLSQMLLPYPQYKGVTDEVAATSNSNYNSLQLSINQRLSHGLTFMLNYTFSKSIDNAGTFRTGYAIPAGVMANGGKPWGLGMVDRSLSTFDQRHNVTGTGTYDLPFGNGKIGSDNVFVRNAAGGWRLSGIFTYVAGNPLALTSSTCTNVVGQGQCMPAYNTAFSGPVRQNGGWGHGATRSTLGTIQYINPAAFVQTGSFTSNPYVLGDVARTAPYGLRGPGNYNIDGSVRRTFDLWNKENVKFVLEANVFNALNHVWFGSTSSNATGSIGQVVGNTSLGTVAGQANNPRQWQFAGHINF
ncbi:MAG: TonB-dependent receptor [Terracidiphilus sp.]